MRGLGRFAYGVANAERLDMHIINKYESANSLLISAHLLYDSKLWHNAKYRCYKVFAYFSVYLIPRIASSNCAY